MSEFTKAAVAARLGLSTDDPEAAELDAILPAVEGMVNAWTGCKASSLWSPRVTLGAAMLAARLHRRRNSPGGVESMTDIGPVYVARRDPDIAMLLGLGEYTRPRVG